ncbi:MAG: hypothetical protein GX245_00895 [Eubacteriaceae bacterium]|jgi:predicted Fe-Mo cluster-binding NifX family protein|nr:hypothetical protein [Eubacteriaceae bacterium]
MVITVINTDGSARSALADILKIHVDTLICGNIGQGACTALTDTGIQYHCDITENTIN